MLVQILEATQGMTLAQTIKTMRVYATLVFQRLQEEFPLRAMRKDFFDTFESYQYKSEVKQDALQFFRGLWNVIRGAMRVVFLGLCLALGLVVLPIFVFIRPALVLAVPLVLLENACIEIVAVMRGLLQIITAPLVFLFKMPLRGILTCRQGEMQTSDLLDERKVPFPGYDLRTALDMAVRLGKSDFGDNKPTYGKPFKRMDSVGRGTQDSDSAEDELAFKAVPVTPQLS